MFTCIHVYLGTCQHVLELKDAANEKKDAEECTTHQNNQIRSCAKGEGKDKNGCMDAMQQRLQYDVSGYAHLRPPAMVNLYRLVRERLGISQSEAARRAGITRQSWQYRERRKYLYWPVEIMALQEMGKLTDEETMQLIKRCVVGM